MRKCFTSSSFFGSIKQKMKTGRWIISTERLTTFHFWSLVQIQPGCDYSEMVLSGKQIPHAPTLSSSFLFLLPIYFYFILFLGGESERDGVYLILLCWHTRLGSDKRASGAVLIQIGACSQWMGAGKGNKIQCDNLSGEGERIVFHSVSQLCCTRWGIFNGT